MNKSAFEQAEKQRLHCLRSAFNIIRVFAEPSCNPEEFAWFERLEAELTDMYSPMPDYANKIVMGLVVECDWIIRGNSVYKDGNKVQFTVTGATLHINMFNRSKGRGPYGMDVSFESAQKYFRDHVREIEKTILRLNQ